MYQIAICVIVDNDATEINSLFDGLSILSIHTIIHLKFINI